MSDQIFIMFAIIGGAALIPFFARRLRIPSAVLEIVYGIILFNSILIEQSEWFLLLKDFGLIYLMFIVGMELDIRRIKGKRFLWYISIPVLSLIITPLVLFRLDYPFYSGVVVAMISAGIIIPVLKELEVINTETGQDIIGIALTGELLSILILMFLDIHHRHGFTVMAVIEGIKFLLLSALAALFLRLLYIMAWWNPEKVEKVMESEDPVEEGIRVVIFLVFTGALIAYVSGLEPILGSFMVGLIFSYVFKSKGRFEDKINAIGFGFFIPLFFIGVGADLNIHLLRSPDVIYLSLFLTIMVFLSKIYPLLFSYFMKIKIVDAFGISLILSTPLSLMVVAGTLGVKMGLIGERMRDAIVLTAIISTIIFTSLFKPIARRMVKGSGNEPMEKNRSAVRK